MEGIKSTKTILGNSGVYIAADAVTFGIIHHGFHERATPPREQSQTKQAGQPSEPARARSASSARYHGQTRGYEQAAHDINSGTEFRRMSVVDSFQ